MRVRNPHCLLLREGTEAASSSLFALSPVLAAESDHRSLVHRSAQLRQTQHWHLKLTPHRRQRRVQQASLDLPTYKQPLQPSNLVFLHSLHGPAAALPAPFPVSRSSSVVDVHRGDVNAQSLQSAEAPTDAAEASRTSYSSRVPGVTHYSIDSLLRW